MKVKNKRKDNNARTKENEKGKMTCKFLTRAFN